MSDSSPFSGSLDQDSWIAVVEAYGPKVWAVTRSFRLEYADACDVFQTVWLNFGERFAAIREPDRVSAWLVTTARNECLRLLKIRGRLLPVRWRPEATAEPPDESLLTAERDQVLWASFQRLSPRCQVLLRLYAFFPEYSYLQLAKAVGLQEPSVGPAKRRCLRRLGIIAGGGL
ncbi:MAG: sigma-70 family RNA polymerase sigma factor [Kibdelosporangium sp.]